MNLSPCRCVLVAAMLMISIQPARAQVPDGMQSELLSATLGLTVTPAKGQSRDTQGADETECYALSKQETGVDPFVSPAPAPAQRASFVQAFVACMGPRGYTAK